MLVRTLFMLGLIPAGIGLAQTEEPVPPEVYKRTVHFEFKAPGVKSAFLVGNMTNWETGSLPMRRTGEGVFYINAEIEPGRIEYVFLADGKPVLDDASLAVDDGKGGRRSFFVLDDDRESQPQEGIPHGKVETRRFRSRALGEERAVTIYTPPGYSRKTVYPVLFLLHGFEMDHDQWISGGIQNYLDRYIAKKELHPWVVVMPGSPSEFYMGRSEDFIVRDVYSFVAREYSIKKGKGAAAIGGTSMGGFGAFYLAYRHPELFGHAMVLSPGSRDGKFLDQLGPELKAGRKVAATLDIRCGMSDNLVLPFTERLVSLLKENNVPLTYELTRGVHDWNYWRSVMKPALLRVENFFYPLR